MKDKFLLRSRLRSKTCLSFFAVLFLLIITYNGIAAPIQQIGPVDIRGTVSDLQWNPEKTIQGIPGMSGSAGHDRIVPAHFLVTLSHYSGVDFQTAAAMTRYVDWSVFRSKDRNDSPSFVTLMINHNNPNFLRKGMNIKISGYTIRGDEGGTWTYFSSINILNQQLPNDDVRSYLETNIESPNSGGRMFCSYELLGKDTGHRTENIYLWTTCMEYYVKNGTLFQGTGVSLPVMLTAEKSFRGYRIRKHIIPREGEDYGESIKRIFPPIYHSLIFTDNDEYNKRATDLLQETEQIAKEFYHIEQEQNISRDGLKLIDFKVSQTQITVGDSVTVTFTLKNVTDQPIEINPRFGVFVGARWNSTTDDNNRDFGHRYKGKVLQPGTEIVFLAVKKLYEAGIWRLWPAYNVHGHWGPFRWHEIVVNVRSKSTVHSCPHTDFEQ